MNGAELRKAMNRALQCEFVPQLRQRGFQGSLPHFRRIGDFVDLLTFQFDRWGGSFVIEISQCGANGVTMHWGEHVPPAKVTAYDLHPDLRRRLGSPAPGEDGKCFLFDEGTDLDALARRSADFLVEADLWWASNPWQNRKNE